MKKLFQNADWLKKAKGQAVKIVAPLLAVVPAWIARRLILIERDYDEIPDSNVVSWVEHVFQEKPARPGHRDFTSEHGHGVDGAVHERISFDAARQAGSCKVNLYLYMV